MGDRISSFTIIMGKDIGEDQAELIKTAMLQVKGVIEVAPNTTDNLAQAVANTRIRNELWNKIREIIYPDFGK